MIGVIPIYTTYWSFYRVVDLLYFQQRNQLTYACTQTNELLRLLLTRIRATK